MLRALLLVFITTIITDVKTITDTVNPIANILADAVAPMHPELIIVAATNEKINVVKGYYVWLC